jgi:hypothetical protein
MHRRLRSFALWAALTAGSVRAGSDREAVVVVGFDGALVDQHPPNGARFLPPVAGPLYFVPQNDLEKGRTALPAPGLVHAVAVYLSRNGYWVAPAGRPATVLLALHWYARRDEVTHFGPPAQQVELAGPGGRGLRLEDEPAANPPFVLISAFDLQAAQAKPQRIVKLWQMALWLRVVRPKGGVEIGSPEVKAYLEPLPVPREVAPRLPRAPD